jgi:GNAT superfamily N-acetyltransferase
LELFVTDIRPATVEDAALILYFVRELAIYEKAEHEVLATEQSIRDTIFCPDSRVDALICEHEGEAIGFAVYFFNYSTWLGKYGLFLEDLYVTPEQRGIGAGKALLSHLARIALDKDCGRFEWNVLDWNEPSIRFYESLDAEALNEWIGYRLSGEALTRLAEQP